MRIVTIEEHFAYEPVTKYCDVLDLAKPITARSRMRMPIGYSSCPTLGNARQSGTSMLLD